LRFGNSIFVAGFAVEFLSLNRIEGVPDLWRRNGKTLFIIAARPGND
jgi:hypothetical protein